MELTSERPTVDSQEPSRGKKRWNGLTRMNFSLRQLLVATFAVSLILACGVLYYKLNIALAEIALLRTSHHLPRIDDRSSVYAVPVLTGQIDVFRWNLYVPATSNSSLQIAIGGISMTGMPDPELSSTHSFQLKPSSASGEMMVEVQLTARPDAATILTVNIDSHRQASIPLSDEYAGWHEYNAPIFRFGPQEGANLEKEKLKPLELIRLVEEKQGRIAASSPPTNGIMVWITE